jgi:hypothetical protein
MIWAKYLRLEFLTHYGSEFYCPFSQLKVFGTTMMEEVKAEEEKPKSTLSATQKEPGKTPSESLIPVPKIGNYPLDVDSSVEEESDNGLKVNLDFTMYELENSANCSMKDLYRNTFTRKVISQGPLIKKSGQGSSDSPQKQGSKKSSKVIQDSIFKNIMKRLNKLEESTETMTKFLEEQRSELQEFMDFLQNEQYEVLLRFVERRWSDVIVRFFLCIGI